MSEGPNHPSGQPQQPGGGRGRRRRRRRGPGAKPGQPGQQSQGQPVQQSQQPPQQQPQGGGAGSFKRRNRKRFRTGGKGGFGKPRQNENAQPGVFSAPMDHNYRTNGNFNGNGNGNGNGSGNPRHFGRNNQPVRVYQEAPLEPVAPGQNGDVTRIYAFIEDLFFLAKINETARKLNVKVQFVKTDKDVLDAVEASGEKPSLILFDLNNHLANPLKTIPKLKKELKKDTNILGFVSHIQGDLKLKAIEAGCDTVVPRSAFSQNLPNLLRRHGAPDELEELQ
jgi:CheY-like chemotaxis protein